MLGSKRSVAHAELATGLLVLTQVAETKRRHWFKASGAKLRWEVSQDRSAPHWKTGISTVSNKSISGSILKCSTWMVWLGWDQNGRPAPRPVPDKAIS